MHIAQLILAKTRQFSRVFSLAGLSRATASRVAMLGNHASRWLSRTLHDVNLAFGFSLVVLLLAWRHDRFLFEAVFRNGQPGISSSVGFYILVLIHLNRKH